MAGPTNLPGIFRLSRGRETSPKRRRFGALLTMGHRSWGRRLIFFFDFSTILC